MSIRDRDHRQEIAVQLAQLRGLAAQLAKLRDLANRPGRVIVYDTNSLMHYDPADHIDWRSETGVKTVRLVVPLIVIDELDRKKYAGSPNMAERAATALQALERLIGDTATAPFRCRNAPGS